MMKLLKKVIARALLPALFNLAGGALADDTVGREVEIIRDAYGVPHVYADDVFGLFYGYGYAVAQDRLYQMEIMRRSVSGTVAEVLGRKYVSFDKKIRSTYSLASIEVQYSALAQERKAILDGYAAGVNTWIKKIQANPGTLIPREFLENGFEPVPWTGMDVAMIFVGTIAHRFSDFNSEVENLTFLNSLTARHDKEAAWQIFNQTKWLNDPGAPTTVPGGKSNAKQHAALLPYPEGLPATASIDKPIGRRFARNDNGEYLDLPDQKALAYLNQVLAKTGISGMAGFPAASNVWIMGPKKAQDADGAFINGPQFGSINPGYVYGIGLHGAGFDLAGGAYFASPAVLFGNNANIGWGSTAGIGDTVDVYAEQLNPDNMYEYFYKGRYQKMGKRRETIAIKDADPATIDVYSTVHGPVDLFDEENGVAYSRRRTWDGLELESMMSFIDATKAQNHEEWLEAAASNAVSVNWYYIDRRGNIGYAHTGRYPVRSKDKDTRLPTPGTGEFEWDGFLPFVDQPQTYNPAQGFIANWNNKPSDDWDNGDTWFFLWATSDRGQFLIDVLEAKDKLTVEEFVGINEAASYADFNMHYFMSVLNEALKNLGNEWLERRALEILNRWDKAWTDRDGDGFYDSPATAIASTWLTVMLENTLKDDIGEKFFYRYASPGYPIDSSENSPRVGPGVSILYHVLNRDDSRLDFKYDFLNGVDVNVAVMRAMTEAVERLSDIYGANPEDWRLPAARQIFRTANFYGIPQANFATTKSIPVIQNRGSENNVVVAKNGVMTTRNVTPPGQSGFVAPDGAVGPHYGDQLDLYSRFDYKKLPLTRNDVETSAESWTALRY
ncbi:MAG: penicillin acylase family protein [Pseudomonadales bacterium]|nr:penicillin acylase family protein [Pseudomonadales bacterium]